MESQIFKTPCFVTSLGRFGFCVAQDREVTVFEGRYDDSRMAVFEMTFNMKSLWQYAFKRNAIY